MSVIHCPLCRQMKDSDFVNCEEVFIPGRTRKYDLICGDCFRDLPEHVPADERAGVLHNDKPVNWTDWGEDPAAAK